MNKPHVFFVGDWQVTLRNTTDGSNVVSVSSRTSATSIAIDWNTADDLVLKFRQLIFPDFHSKWFIAGAVLALLNYESVNLAGQEKEQFDDGYRNFRTSERKYPSHTHNGSELIEL